MFVFLISKLHFSLNLVKQYFTNDAAYTATYHLNRLEKWVHYLFNAEIYNSNVTETLESLFNNWEIEHFSIYGENIENFLFKIAQSLYIEFGNDKTDGTALNLAT